MEPDQEQELVSVHFLTDHMPVTPAPISYSVGTQTWLSISVSFIVSFRVNAFFGSFPILILAPCLG